MEKLLDQEQINAIFRARRGEGTQISAEPVPSIITDCDLRHPTHLTNEQVRSVTTLHDTVAKNLMRSMGAYLRVGFEVAIVSVEQLTYAEFLGRLPDITYLCSLNVSPIGALAVLQLDLQMGFPIIDLLLGGTGAAAAEVRDATEIEEELLGGIVKIIARELAVVWSNAGFNIEFDERQLPAAAQRLMRPIEKTMVVSFELRMLQVQGTLNVAFPASVANTLLRKLARDAAPKAPAKTSPEGMIRNLLLDCEFSVQLEIARTRVPLRALVGMTPGSILLFDHSIREHISLTAGDLELFYAKPVQTDHHRGAQLDARVSRPREEKGNHAI